LLLGRGGHPLVRVRGIRHGSKKKKKKESKKNQKKRRTYLSGSYAPMIEDPSILPSYEIVIVRILQIIKLSKRTHNKRWTKKK